METVNLADTHPSDLPELLERRNKTAVVLHDHSFLELSYILRGEVLHTLDGQTTRLRAGDYVFIDRGSHHGYRALSDSYDYFDCLFLPQVLDPALAGTVHLSAVLTHYLLHLDRRLLADPAHLVFHDENGEVLTLLRQLQRELSARPAGCREMCRCLLVEIFLLSLRSIADTDAPADTPAARLCSYAKAHFAEDISLTALAAAMHYSLPHISRSFKAEVGMTFTQYVTALRVSQACRLLADTALPIAAVAEAVGYHDMKCFAAQIKARTGFPPAAFRRRHRGNAAASFVAI